MDDPILDRIYEAGVVPELWPMVLEELGNISNTTGTLLFAAGDGAAHWTASPALEEMSRGYFAADYSARDERTRSLLARDHAGFLTDLDVFSLEEWEADPIRREYFVPRGYGWGIATAMRVPTGELLILHGEGRLEDGPIGADAVARLDRLRPHLARAALMSTRIAFERAQGAVAALEMVGIPAAVVDGRGRAIAVNGLLESLTPDILQLRTARLGLVDSVADALLLAATGAAGKTGHPEIPRSIPIAARNGRPPMLVHVHPVTGSARDIFSGASAVLLVTPVVVRDLPAASVIQGLFDLTPAEARVARALGGGMTVAQIAAENSASVATVRNQVQAVFSKTGMHRQADLVGLLQGLSPVSEANSPSQ